MESPTVQGTPESAQESGLDGGKWMKGRKRPRVVDTRGYAMFDFSGDQALKLKVWPTESPVHENT